MSDTSSIDQAASDGGIGVGQNTIDYYAQQNATRQQQQQIGLRIKGLTRMNPYMSDRPDVLLALAQSPLDNQTLMDQGGALFGMQASDTMRKSLEGMNPGEARGVFAQLTSAQQMSLHQQGYQEPQRDEGSVLESILHPLGTAAHDVLNVVGEAGSLLHVKDALNGLAWIADQPAHLYRAIRTCPPRNRSPRWQVL